MKQLIEKLMAEGLTEIQSGRCLEIIKQYTKERFPMLSNAVDIVFEDNGIEGQDDFFE